MKEKWTLHKDEIEAIYCDSLTQNERNAVASFKQYIAEEAKRGGYWKPEPDFQPHYPSNALKPKAPKPKPTPAPPVVIRPFWDRWDSWDVETKPFP